MVSTMPTSLVYWSLGWTQAMPYLFAGVDTVFIPVVVQQPPTFAQCCQILHNRVQSFFFICKKKRETTEVWKATSPVEVQSKNTVFKIQTFNPNGSKDTMSSLPIKRSIQRLHHSPSQPVVSWKYRSLRHRWDRSSEKPVAECGSPLLLQLAAHVCCPWGPLERDS